MNSPARKILFAISVSIACAVGAILFMFDPTRVPIYPVCQFHQITGLDCPGCGGLRAAHELLHGHLIAALHFNALAVFSVPLFVVFGGRLLWREFNGRLPTAFRPSLVWLYLGIWIAFGVVRNLPMQPFTAFAP